MSERYFIFALALLFFISSVWLTVKQEALFQKGNQDFVSLSFVEPRNSENSDFTVTYGGNTPRDITLLYRYANDPEEMTAVTLGPQETKLFKPAKMPQSVILRYENADHEEQEISLTKK